MSKYVLHIIIIISIILIGCEKDEQPINLPFMISESVLISSDVVYRSPSELIFDLNIVTLDPDKVLGNEPQRVGDAMESLGFIEAENYTFELDTVTEEMAVNKGDYSVAILIDKSLVGNDVENQSTDFYEAWNFFVQNTGSSNEFLFASYSDAFSQTYEPITNGFINEASQGTLDVLEMANQPKTGSTNMYEAIDQMLDYVDENATKDNKSIVVYWHNRDTNDVISIDSLIEKANLYEINISFISYLGSQYDFYPLAYIAHKTGGFQRVGMGQAAASGISIMSLHKILSGNYYLYRFRISVIKSGSWAFLNGRVFCFYLYVGWSPICYYFKF